MVVVVAIASCLAAAQTPQPASSPATPNPKLKSLFVVGDSTANNNANGARGWGDPFADYFDLSRLNVINRARAGRSSRTFVTEGLWDKVLSELKAGDYVLIQFGHNDGGPLDSGRARGSLPGLGEETREVTLASGKTEVVHTFGWYMRKMVDDVKTRHATAIVLSLTVRNIWKDGKVERGSGKFGEWAAAVAQSEGVSFIDLTKIVADQYEQLGEERVAALFAGDHTHTAPAGAELNAASVVAGLKGLKRSKLTGYLSKRGKTISKA
jgi:lysophospholipase L1-like esterase